MARPFLYCRWRKLPDFSLGANFFRGSCPSGASRLVISVQPKPRSMDMTQVTDPFADAPQLMKQWMATSLAVQDSLETSLIELVKLRATIFNGSATCTNMHNAKAPTAADREQHPSPP